MKDYILVWRFFPKMCLGAAFIFELLALSFGLTKTLRAINVGFNAIAVYFTGATLLVALILIIAVIANIGIFALNFLSVVMPRAFSYPLLRLVKAITGKSTLASDLHDTPSKIAIRIFKDNPDYFLMFFKLRSLSATELGKRKQLDSYMKDVNAHLFNISDAWIIEAINYYTSLSQDRRLFESAADEIKTLWSLFAVVLLGIPVAMISGLSVVELLIAITILLLVCLSLLLVIIRRKRFLGVMMIAGYFDNFSVGTPSQVQVTDREGEAML